MPQTFFHWHSSRQSWHVPKFICRSLSYCKLQATASYSKLQQATASYSKLPDKRILDDPNIFLMSKYPKWLFRSVSAFSLRYRRYAHWVCDGAGTATGARKRAKGSARQDWQVKSNESMAKCWRNAMKNCLKKKHRTW